MRAYLPADDALALRVEHPELSPAERADADRATAEAEFQSALDELRKDGLDVEGHFVKGAASAVIFDTAKATWANLIVMSTHSRGGLARFVYGSVADEVLRRVPVPVLFVSANCTEVWDGGQPQRVLVPLDGSSLAAEAVRPARELAATLGGELLLLAVVEPTAVYPYEPPETIVALEAADRPHRREEYLAKVQALVCVAQLDQRSRRASSMATQPKNICRCTRARRRRCHRHGEPRSHWPGASTAGERNQSDPPALGSAGAGCIGRSRSHQTRASAPSKRVAAHHLRWRLSDERARELPEASNLPIGRSG